MGQQSPKRKLDVPEADSPKKKKRRLSDSPPPQLPLEIVSMIITAATDSTPKCALDLLVPDWNICNGNNDKLQRDMLDSRRVVTYTRGIDGGVGTLSSAAGSADHSHIFLPMQTLDTDLMSVNEAFLDENIRSFFQEGTQVFQLTANYPPPDVAEASFLKWWRDSFPLRGERSRLILPFDDEVDGTPKREMSSGGPCLFKLLRHIVVNSPLALMDVNARSMVGPGTGISEKNLKALDDAIDLDRAAHLWLSWSQMPMLKSVLLDLRIYSHDLNTERECISKYDIVRRAEEMGRWLQLDLLVIAGLQSYSFQASNEVYTAGQIEEVDEIDDEPNWIKVFMPAVRPGGKLVLVDSLT
ncbi:uncharacterized protein GGS25DRAFT_484465 [Hypoxylon fragiforme]|uniref:uncharacterized protein n=1 Tax=Hypoxylon fragiforme TaxID=63214 RepID=UPI0020C6257A|nr:uncharacterized protein GGS25DRAFT_484465 [Hypoxylon fragiforme]KAI2609386.1 hypothetical protein GGS25DRAFT_484465 [Hypoxylon fragiforme]